ncbi:MAG: type II toxin-antitoxin system HicA family toxin [Candidatus Adiutrix sp.]|nr:type II toxin-antitoxin system HicA family toxin [Candidatus Adiutrix sp.]
MNSKNRKTLENIFSQPTKSDIKWSDIAALLVAVGAQMSEGEGSRVRFMKGTVKMTTHRPHPAKEAKPYQVETARVFLKELGVKP